jgi:hypothetical protein
MKKSSFVALVVAVAMAACSSVPLDDVPVENKTPGAIGGQTPPGGGSATRVGSGPA